MSSNEVIEILNKLRSKREMMAFIGGNYEKDELILNAIKEAVKDAGYIPIIAKEVFKDIDPSKIHDESLRLLHNCGFAVIDITNPAGQLMELERARDYGVVTFVSYSSRHPSKMPVTLSKVMENWGLGYLFSYEDINGLKNFVKNVLLINHSKMKPEKIIKEVIGKKKYEELILITSIGVLKNVIKEDTEIKNLLEKFSKRVIITGWDYKTRGKREAERYGANWVACEGGCLLYNLESEELLEDFCDENSLRIVKTANKWVIYAINEYCEEHNLVEIVFYSQADERSICYYLNPPKNIREELEKLRVNKDIGVNEFEEKVKERCGITPESKTNDKIEYTKPEYSEAEEALLYAIEKVNATFRTFLPYSIKIEGNKIVVDLNPSENYREFTYRDVENIVEKALEKMKDSYELVYNRIIPQKDVCIDILCKSKDEILIPLLKRVVEDEKKEDTLIVYLSKGTESDIPMILKGYSSGYNFIAIGSDNISDRLKRAGVIPLGESISKAIKKFLK